MNEEKIERPYIKDWNNFLEKCGESEPDFEVEFSAAWNSFKNRVLEILVKNSNSYDTKLDYIQKCIKDVEQL